MFEIGNDEVDFASVRDVNDNVLDIGDIATGMQERAQHLSQMIASENYNVAAEMRRVRKRSALTIGWPTE